MAAALAETNPGSSGAWDADGIGLGGWRDRASEADVRSDNPVVAGDGTRVLVADGRVDNRRDLAVPLSLSLAQIRASPVPEIVCRSFEHWGTDCLDRLVGEFTFAQWDGSTRDLVPAEHRWPTRAPPGSPAPFS